MEKQNYTQVQVLLPEIEAILVEGKSQEEVPEYCKFIYKYVVKHLLVRERRKERKLEAGILRGRKDGRGKILYPKTLWQSKPVKSSIYA